MKKIITLTLFITLAAALAAESLLTLDLQLLQAVGYDKDSAEWTYGGSGTADLVVKSTGSKNVKGELSLEYIPLDGLAYGYTMINLDKASIKVQFPSLRLTMGKTRIGWGEGYVFNAGDVLYGSLDPSVDLTAGEVRSDTALLTLVRWTAGRNYAEAIVMAPSVETEDYVTYTQPGITATSAGGRVVTEILNTAVELGYLCKGQEKTTGDVTGHRPYLSLHGYGDVDWYCSASLAVPFEEAQWEDNIRETAHFSAGSFRQFGLGYNGTLSVRLEALVYPWGQWEEQSEAESYGLYLYPEINFAIGQNLNLPVMAVLSPVDRSGQITAGLSWSVYQGFSFLGYAVAEVGGDNDTFQTENFYLMGGMNYKF